MPHLKSPNPVSRTALALCILACCAAGYSPHAAAQTKNPSGYKLAATWKVSGDGSWDYLTVDPAANRLYIARDNRIQVIDTNSGALIGEVPGLNGAHGVALVPGLNRGFATSGKDGKVIAFDLVSLKPVGQPIPAGTKPDAIAYDPRSNHVFAMNGGSNDITVIDPGTGQPVGEIPLPGPPEFAVADGEGDLIVNILGKDEVAVVDTETKKVKSEWSVLPGERPTGIAVDPDGHHIFSGCPNKHLIVLDSQTGNKLADLDIGGGVDSVRFDPGTGYAFASCGSDGTLAVAAPDATGKFKILDTVQTKKGARTMTLDPRTHAIYVCSADFAASTNKKGKSHQQPVPGTFVVLKFTR